MHDELPDELRDHAEPPADPRYAGIPPRWGRTEDIEERVLPVIHALNALPDLWTDSSCGGHNEPKAGTAQRKYPEWYVGFAIAESAYGVWSLTRVVAALEEDDAYVMPWYDGGLRFTLEAATEPADLAAALVASVPAVFAERP